MNKIEINRLTTGYPGRRGFIEIEKDLTATLRGGEFTCLLGPNGAGKTTLLRTLSGFLPPLSGTIMIDGRELRSYSHAELARKIGVVLTERPDVTSMTVEQLVALGRSPYTGFWGRLTGKDEKVVERSMELAHVQWMRGRLVSTLSEPTAFLDFRSKVETMQLLKKLARQEGKIIFQSTHDVNMALQLADRIWLVDKNLGVSIGTPSELAENGELVRFFSGDGIRFNPDTGVFDLVIG